MRKARSKKPSAPPLDWAPKYLDIADVFIVVIKPDETVGLINRKGCEVLGYQPDEVVGKNWFNHFVPKQIRSQVRDTFRKLMGGATRLVERFENPVVTRSGEQRMIAWHNAVVEDDSGKILGSLSSGEDITEQRRHREALQQREAELQAIVDTAVDGIITIDSRGNVLSFNRAAERIFGYPAGEVIGKNVKTLMPEPYHSEHDDYLRRYQQTGQAQIIGIGREVEGRRKDGTVFPLYLAVSEVHLQTRLVYTGIVRDLSQLKQMQKQMLEAESLAAIGEMATSVAHEVKNPLAGIAGAIQVMKDTPMPEHSRQEVMQEILDQVNRLDNSVRQLLMLAKPWKPEKQIYDLRKLVEQVSERAAKLEVFRSIRFVLKEENEEVAPLDPALVEQVLWNLIHNAGDAMPEAGEIRFSFDHEPDYAVLRVFDTGSGIPTGDQERLFRPFFTTKTRGAGLGLSICKKIMEAHGGSISISSQPGRGTEVTLRFPKNR